MESRHHKKGARRKQKNQKSNLNWSVIKKTPEMSKVPPAIYAMNTFDLSI